jgi:hypothetical protein
VGALGLVTGIVCGLAISSLIGGLIGQGRGRQADGALVGFLLGPIGWVIALALADLRAKCPLCGGVIVEGMQKCRNCGSDLPQPEKVDLRLLVPEDGSQGVEKVDGLAYTLITGRKDEAFCFVCRRCSSMEGMYHNEESGVYCHPVCLSRYAASKKPG